MPGNQLVLGLAAGYHYGDVSPFLISLERAGYRGELVLFVSKTTRDLDRINKHNVTVVPLSRPVGLEEIPYNALRYFLYLNYLKSSGSRFKQILLTDVRDVIFQRNPFDYPWANGVKSALEAGHMTIGECPHNSHWTREHLGQKAWRAISHHRISCSGTTLADHDSMMAYLEDMTAGLTPFKPGKRMAGYDQAVHNLLVHTGRLQDVTLHDNAGPILTLGYVRRKPEKDPDGFVLNMAGKPAHMVHQYDRKPELHKALQKRYCKQT